MLKYFVVPLVFFSISFSFIYDSHIGDHEKTEVDYIEYPVLVGFADTPKEGRLRTSFGIYPKKFISRLYDQSGEELIIDNDSRRYLHINTIILDYYGYKRSGIKLMIANTEFDYKDTELINLKYPLQIFSIYFLWGDKFTFPVQNLKSEIGYTDSLGLVTSHALDYKLTNKQIWSNEITMTTRTNSTDSYPSDKQNTLKFRSKLICNFSENLALSAMYQRYKIDRVIFGNEITSSLTSIELAAGLQLVKMNYGYYNFNFKLSPSLIIPISGKIITKQEQLSLSLIFDFI